jgi:hypothetical protein
MKRIRIADIVSFGNGEEGKVLQVITTAPTSKVYKIQHLVQESVVYFDESKICLKQQRLENKLKDLVGLD